MSVVAVLALLTMVLVFVPIQAVRKALQEILLITPPELDARVREVMDGVIARHGFKTYTSYVAKVGRAQFIEIHVAVPPESSIDSVGTADALRREISEAIGGDENILSSAQTSAGATTLTGNNTDTGSTALS
eukprot:gene41360-51211_t